MVSKIHLTSVESKILRGIPAYWGDLGFQVKNVLLSSQDLDSLGFLVLKTSQVMLAQVVSQGPQVMLAWMVFQVHHVCQVKKVNLQWGSHVPNSYQAHRTQLVFLKLREMQEYLAYDSKDFQVYSTSQDLKVGQVNPEYKVYWVYQMS